jgi:hypothetical protein
MTDHTIIPELPRRRLVVTYGPCGVSLCDKHDHLTEAAPAYAYQVSHGRHWGPCDACNGRWDEDGWTGA